MLSAENWKFFLGINPSNVIKPYQPSLGIARVDPYTDLRRLAEALAEAGTLTPLEILPHAGGLQPRTREGRFYRVCVVRQLAD